MKIYVECEDFVLNKKYVSKLNIFQYLFILLFNDNSIIQVKRIPKKEIKFY